MKLKETIYAGRNNSIRLKILEDGIPFAIAYPTVTPTRWVLVVGSLIFDSTDIPNSFSWDSETSVLEILLGNQVASAIDFTAAEMTLYSAEWPDGVIWLHPTASQDRLLIRIIDPVFEE